MNVFQHLQSLGDLCGIHIAYLMWTRRDVVRCCSEEELYDELVHVVLADVGDLPLPKRVKSLILKNVKPAGKRLLSLLNSWRSKTQPENYRKWLTSAMLFECLILNADGHINHRKTAEKILSRRILNNVFAFRMACVNFLEKEVFKLWKIVKQYFLNKIILESGQPHLFSRAHSFREILVKRDFLFKHNCSYDYPMVTKASLSPFPCTTEPDEVLFWISYCLSKENGINIEDVPHFIGDNVDWFDFSLKSAAFSNNVSCFDYFKNFCKRQVEYSHEEIILGNYISYDIDSQQTCFIFHFMQLDLPAKEEFLRQHTHSLFISFLEWPLSQTFVENTERMWNLVPDLYKSWLLENVFGILFSENILLNPINADLSYLGKRNLIYSGEHLRRIWIDLWEKSSDSDKLIVLDSIIFKIIERSRKRQKFRNNFKVSGLKDKLLHLFLTNGEAILELFENENMKESLRSLVSKYMPEDFQDLNRICISYLKTSTVEHIMKMKDKMKHNLRKQDYNLTRVKNRSNPIHENFLNYIKNCCNE